MELYGAVKWLHIISAAMLFGTGIGTAFQMWMSHRSGDVGAIAQTTDNVVRADWLFTATAGVLQPVTGAALIVLSGQDPLDGWLVASYALFALALACWLPVVWLQYRVRALARAAAASQNGLPEAYFRYMKYWFALGWPAFLALLVIFYLMVNKGFE